MTDLYLVRHAQTEYNRLGIVQGQGIDASINDRGRVQARLLARRLAEIDVDALYASTLTRSIQTARTIADHRPRRLPIREEAGLDEISWGVLEGEGPSPEIQARMRAVKEAWRDGKYDRRLEGGESAEEVRRRGRRTVRDIARRHEDGTVVAVVHGRFLRIVLSDLLELETARMHEMDHSNTGVNHLVVEDGTFTDRRLNCVRHLDEADLVAAE
jgi:probable phosphoglycerate mutase